MKRKKKKTFGSGKTIFPGVGQQHSLSPKGTRDKGKNKKQLMDAGKRVEWKFAHQQQKSHF